MNAKRPYSGWCTGTAWAYAPGTGAYWADAWTPLAAPKSGQLSPVENSGVTASPNPAQNKVLIYFNKQGVAEIQLFNTYGQEVLIDSFMRMNLSI